MAEDFELSTTARGFAILGFVDRGGEPCSLQKSSLAEGDCIWLGRDGTDEPGRMHLTREMVAALLPHLQRFAETGELRVAEAAEARDAQAQPVDWPRQLAQLEELAGAQRLLAHRGLEDLLDEAGLVRLRALVAGDV